MSGFVSYATARRRDSNGGINKLYPEDRPIHDWYRFVLSFPPHLVREYVERFGLNATSRVLDPFCGTGTVLVECKKLGIPSVGVEANPVAQFASKIKIDWSADPHGLVNHARRIAELASERLREDGVDDNPLFLGYQSIPKTLRELPSDSAKLLLADSMSPLPLHKTLMLLELLEQHADERYERYERLALAKTIVYSASNLHFGPEIGVGPARADSPVVAAWLGEVMNIAEDLKAFSTADATPAKAYLGDARDLSQVLEPRSISAVITSPPYPNEKDYTRTTRLELVLLGFIQSKADLRSLKQGFLRSNTRGVYKDDTDDRWIAEHTGIQRIARAIEARRIELGKTSGFERLYHRVTKLYFGGMARHLASLKSVLQPGAQLAYVVGDQASYLRVMIRTGQLIADIGVSLGYELESINLFRTRLATATRDQLREEVVVLRWPGETPGSAPRRKLH
jgi:hypothetical protein